MEFFSLKMLLAGGHFNWHTLGEVWFFNWGHELCFDSRVILQAIKFPKLQIITGSPDV